MSRIKALWNPLPSWVRYGISAAPVSVFAAQAEFSPWWLAALCWVAIVTTWRSFSEGVEFGRQIGEAEGYARAMDEAFLVTRRITEKDGAKK